MLKKRLIPKLLLKRRRMHDKDALALVTSIQFQDYVVIGDPVSQAKIYQAQLADELIFLDLDRTLQSEPSFFIGLLQEVAKEIFMPFAVGGGIRTLEDIRLLLSNGADKVSLNSAVFEHPELIPEAAKQFGSQSLIASIDARKDSNGDYFVWIRSGKEKTEQDPVSWALQCEKMGAGEILLTSIDRDGTQQGLDLELVNRVRQAVSVPLIVSGGCGKASHFLEGFIEGRADAVSAGTFFAFKDQNPMQTRSHIKSAGIPIRIGT